MLSIQTLIILIDSISGKLTSLFTHQHRAANFKLLQSFSRESILRIRKVSPRHSALTIVCKLSICIFLGKSWTSDWSDYLFYNHKTFSFLRKLQVSTGHCTARRAMSLRPLLTTESMTSLLHSQRHACHSISNGSGYSSSCVKLVSSLRKEMKSYQTPRRVLKLATLRRQSKPV